MNKKVYYVANIRLPNAKAHGLQLAKMVGAFVEAGLELELVLPWKGPGDLFGGISMARCPAVRRMPVVNLLPNNSFGFNLAAGSFMVSSFLFLLWKRFLGERAIIYTIDLDQFSFCLLPLIGWPVFMEMHGSKRSRLPFRFFLKRVKGVVAVSEWTKRRVSEVFGLPSERFLVYPNGVADEMLKVNFDQATARKKLGLPAEGKICVYIGRIYDWKGLEVLPEAAEIIGELAHIYFIGGEGAKLQRLVGRTLPSNLHVIPSASSAEVASWLAAADILLVTGTRFDEYSYYETSPMKLTEYMAARRPIVAARTPAIQSVVSSGEVIFYEPDNGQDLGDKIKYSLSHYQELDVKVRQAFEKVKGLTWLKRAEAIIRFMVVSFNLSAEFPAACRGDECGEKGRGSGKREFPRGGKQVAEGDRREPRAFLE